MNGPHIWRVGHGRSLELDRARLMGILNVTPDSFSDGGDHNNPERAVARAMAMHEQGAEIVDIGGESTRPGSASVGEDEQIARTIPVIERLVAGGYGGLISIDTTRARVARKALSAGAQIVNDVSAGEDDERMLSLAAETGAGLVLMHRLRAPAGDSFSDAYESEPEYEGGVVSRVRDHLLARCDDAIGAGVRRESIVIDPGLGFGKSVAQNYELVRATEEFVAMGYPVLGAASRKSFIGAVTGQREPAERVEGSLAVSVAQFLAGVRLFRVHDVSVHARALAAANAVLAGLQDRARGGI